MKENFIHLLSETPCLISINGKDLGVIDNTNNFEIDLITKTEKLFVTYTPIINQKNMLPYTFLLNTIDSPKSDNEYIKIVPYPNNNYDIIMKPFYYYQIDEAKVLLNQSLGNYYVSIITDTITRINILSATSIVFTLNITTTLKEAKAESKKELIIIKGIVDNDTYYLLIIDSTNFSILHNDISHSIEVDDGFYQSLKKLNNISHHAIVNKIDFEKKSIEKFYVYEDNYATPPNDELIIPRAFLECVIIQDIELAKNFLSPNYSNTQIIQFQNYFGDIKEIYLNRHLIKQGKINYTIFTNNKYKNYNFVMVDGKISDIEENF